MTTRSIALSALIALTACAPAVLADQFTFSFSGNGVSGSGIVTTSGTAMPGYDAITGISGVFSDTNDGISGAIGGLYTPISYVAPPGGTPAYTTSGFSYDDTFYPAGNSPNNCADYPFYGGVFDVYGVSFTVGGNIVDLWSDGVIPGLGLTYAVGDSTSTTILDDPNPDGSNQALPTGLPVSFSSSPVPEPGFLALFGVGLLLLSRGAAFIVRRA